MKQLIIHCDDYGLSETTNEAIESCIEDGIVRSVSVFANADRTRDCVRLKQRFGDCVSIGLHVNLVARKALSPPDSIESLVDENGCFFAYPNFRRRVLTGRIRTRDIEREILEQARTLQGLIGEISHFDSHKHTHVFPPVVRAISRAAAKLAVSRVRSNRRRYVSSERVDAGGLRIRLQRLRRDPLQLVSAGMKLAQSRVITRAGLRSPDGLLTFFPRIPKTEFEAYEDTWLRTISRFPEGTYEINFHPGGIPVERRLLRSEKIASALKSNGISLVSYDDI